MEHKNVFSPTSIKKLSDPDLVGLLFTEGDELPMSMTDKFVSRGVLVVDYLRDINYGGSTFIVKLLKRVIHRYGFIQQFHGIVE